MALTAVQISPYALEGLRAPLMGHVHSVFNTSFNVELDGALVHVGRDADAFSCTSITIPAGEMPLVLDGLKPGQVVTVRNDYLRLYRSDGTVSIDLQGAEPVNCSVPHLFDVESARWALSWLGERRLRERSGLPPSAETMRALTGLREGTSSRRIAEHVRYLCGRGLGLTPSGDDVLLGYACARSAFGQATGLVDLLAKESTGRTTPVACSYVEAFSRGGVNPVYRDLLLAARNRDAAAFGDAATSIEHIGSTSGVDALLGLSIGFSYVATHAASPVHTAA